MSDHGQSRVPNAAQWDAFMQGEAVQLSRFPVWLRRVDALDMIMSDGLIPGVLRQLEQSGGEGSVDWEQLAEQLPQLKPVLDKVALAAVAEPTLVASGEADIDANEIPLAWLTTADKLIIFGKVFGEMQRLLGPFPGQPGADVSAAPDRDDIRAAARDAAGVDRKSE